MDNTDLSPVTEAEMEQWEMMVRDCVAPFADYPRPFASIRMSAANMLRLLAAVREARRLAAERDELLRVACNDLSGMRARNRQRDAADSLSSVYGFLVAERDAARAERDALAERNRELRDKLNDIAERDFFADGERRLRDLAAARAALEEQA